MGTLLSAIPWARVIGVPIAQILAPIAPIAWIPLAIVLFGTGDGAAVFVVFMGITASMSLATVAALGGVPGEYIKSARSLGSKGWRLWLRVILPAAAPGVATAIRLSFFAAWMSVLAGEMAGINSGLGSLVILGLISLWVGGYGMGDVLGARGAMQPRPTPVAFDPAPAPVESLAR